MSLTPKLSVASIVVLLLGACSESPPACRQSYSNRGDRQAIQELVADFRDTVGKVRSHGNLMLLQEAQTINQSRDLVAGAMGLQSTGTYGRP